ncbi:hypothetical protein Tco_0185270 [Tanacetum coccineum]
MDKCKTGLRYNVVPPPYTGNFMPPKFDLVYPSLDDFVDVNESVSKTRMEIVPGKYYILLPLWTQDPPFSSSSKDSPDDGFKPSGEEEKMDTEDPGNEDSEVTSTREPRVNQEKDANVNSTQY